MTPDEISERYPRAAARIAAEAAEAERKRIRRIEDVARPGHEGLVETAKFERTETTADDVARAMLRRDRRIRRSAARGRTDFNEEDRR